MDHTYRSRRAFLKTLGVATAGATVGAGTASANHSDGPTITFPNGMALVLDNEGPMQAAIRTTNVYMPDGGWVVISTDAGATNIIGQSAQRLPAGHFRDLKVASHPQPSGTYTLYATLFKGTKRASFPGEGPAGYNWTQDSAEITVQ